jgi:pimeloyl-ACP methyl ester carboxylesterase
VAATFTPWHRGGSGPPLVCLHGFGDTWRTWELVLPMLEQHHDVLAVTLPGHAGGPPLGREMDDAVLGDGVLAAMAAADFEHAHLVGNSLGGFVALQLAARGRALSVVALAPAGGWARRDTSFTQVMRMQRRMRALAKAAAPYADAIVRTRFGARRVTELVTVRFDHIPRSLLAHQVCALAAATAADELVDYAIREEFRLDAERIECPVRIVWGMADRLLPYPDAAVRYRQEWLPSADWVELDDVGHCPQLDVPLETAELILGTTVRGAGISRRRG